MSKTISDEKRLFVFNKTNGHCAYCGKKLFLEKFKSNGGYHPDYIQIDHIKPLHNGGWDEPNNLLPSCRSCNSGKRIKSLEEYRTLQKYKQFNIRFSKDQKKFLAYNLSIDLDKWINENMDFYFYFEEIGLELQEVN